MFDLTSAEIGNRYEAAADADLVLVEGEGGGATVIALLKAILLELRLLRAAGCETDQGTGA